MWPLYWAKHRFYLICLFLSQSNFNNVFIFWRGVGRAAIQVDHMGVFRISSEFILHLSFGRTQSLCHTFPPSPSLPLCIYSSPPIRVLAVRGARRKAWTWRCLGSITHDDTRSTATSYRRTAHFEAEVDSLITFKLESASFADSSRHFSYLFLTADESQTSSSLQRRWV